jgi:ABC-type lipoprotein export system ATPase subunit
MTTQTPSNSPGQPVLSLRDVRKSFRREDGRELEVVRIAKFDLATGQQVALAGHSGSGKSSLLNLIAGILLPDAGQIIVKGENIASLPEAKRDQFRASHIGYIFQTFNLLQGFTALENVMLAQIFVKGRGHDKQRAAHLLETMQLGERLHHKPRALSVGEQQRVAIARALVNEPSLVLADEPTGSLDEKNERIVLELLQEVCRENNYSLLLVTHEPEVVAQFSQVVRMDDLNHEPR